MLEHGYARLTTAAVAQRAGVSRGAQQHHFGDRTELLAAAVRELADRQLVELEERVAAVGPGPNRTARILDVLFQQYGGPLFGLVLELALAARSDPEVHAVVTEQEAAINRAIHATSKAVFGDAISGSPTTARRWALALSATRGTAVLTLLGHPAAGVQKQWRATRQELAALLDG